VGRYIFFVFCKRQDETGRQSGIGGPPQDPRPRMRTGRQSASQGTCIQASGLPSPVTNRHRAPWGAPYTSCSAGNGEQWSSREDKVGGGTWYSTWVTCYIAVVALQASRSCRCDVPKNVVVAAPDPSCGGGVRSPRSSLLHLCASHSACVYSSSAFWQLLAVGSELLRVLLGYVCS
jgi:hypothetical protein